LSFLVFISRGRGVGIRSIACIEWDFAAFDSYAWTHCIYTLYLFFSVVVSMDCCGGIDIVAYWWLEGSGGVVMYTGDMVGTLHLHEIRLII
jgi:hypothetical protein